MSRPEIPPATLDGWRGFWKVKVGPVVVWTVGRREVAVAIVEFLNHDGQDGNTSRLARAGLLVSRAPALKLPQDALANMCAFEELAETAGKVLA